jgi:hypothetical protein
MHPDNNVNDISDNPVVDNGRAGFLLIELPAVTGVAEGLCRKVIDTLNDLTTCSTKYATKFRTVLRPCSGRKHICAFIRECEEQQQSSTPWALRLKVAIRTMRNCSQPGQIGFAK